jgi:hypothetical protein
LLQARLILGAADPPATPRIPKPTFENVFVTGTLSSVTGSVLRLAAISVSPHYSQSVRALAGRPLSVEYGSDHSELGTLKAGGRLSLAVDIIGFPDGAFRDSKEFGARGIARKVFWTASVRLAAYGPLLPIREAPSTSMGSIRGVGIIMAILRAMAR